MEQTQLFKNIQISLTLTVNKEYFSVMMDLTSTLKCRGQVKCSGCLIDIRRAATVTPKYSLLLRTVPTIERDTKLNLFHYFPRILRFYENQLGVLSPSVIYS